MPRYAHTHRIVDFIARTIPGRGEGQFDTVFIHNVIAVLKRLDAIQARNSWLTLNFQTGSGIRVFYRGQLAFTLKPAQRHIRLIVGRHWRGPAVKKIVGAIETCNQAKGHFAQTKDSKTHRQWLLDAAGSQAFCDIIEGLEMGNAGKRLSASDHPRHFPGDVRQAALDAFDRAGKWCPGVVGRKKHKINIDAGDKVEFDHILPNVKGGSNSALNIQVLCSECNRTKRDTAK